MKCYNNSYKKYFQPHSHTIIDPRTMMIVNADTSMTNFAMF